MIRIMKLGIKYLRFIFFCFFVLRGLYKSNCHAVNFFIQFLTTQNVQVDILGFCVNLLLTAILAECLCFLYNRFSRSLSNKEIFSRNFIFIAMTTMVIISVVKSSLALSLGLVGALSIVRFRTAIKDPEELSYLFLNIAIGLGLGANQRAITLIGFSLIVLFVVLKNFRSRKKEDQNLYLVISSRETNKFDIDVIIGILKKHCPLVVLKRFDETSDLVEAVFLIEFKKLDIFNKCKIAMKESYPGLNISLTDLNAIS